jgi:hypothetical protein
VGGDSGEATREPGAGFFGVVVEGAEATSIGDVARFVDDVDAFGPGGVEVVGAVVHSVHGHRNGKIEAVDKVLGDGDALGERLGLSVANALIDIGLHLPFVLRMGFPYVDGEEICTVFVVVVHLYEVSHLATEWRSSVAAKYEYEGAQADVVANVIGGASVQRREWGVRENLVCTKCIEMPLGNRVAQHPECVARPSDSADDYCPDYGC